MLLRPKVSRVARGVLVVVLVSCASCTTPQKPAAAREHDDEHADVLALLRSLGARDQESILLKTDQYTLYFDTRKSWSVRLALPSNEEATSFLDPFLGPNPHATTSKPAEDNSYFPDLLAAPVLSDHFRSIMQTLVKALPSEHTNLIPAPGESVRGYLVLRWSGKVEGEFRSK
jgi:hypothetical protein